MLFTILLDVIFALITSIFALIYCGINMKISYAAFIFVVLGALATLGAGGYLSFSVIQLVQYHYYLLQTGVLTKEDSGPENATVAGPFSRFSVY